MLQYIKIVWLFYFPLAFMIFLTFLKYKKPKLPEFEITDLKTADYFFLIFQITSKGTNARVVKRGIKSIHDSCNGILKNYRIAVVVEPEASISGNANIIIVPKKFKTENGTLHKARANHYALLLRREEGENTPYYWIYHMDEESVLTKQCLFGLLEFIIKSKKTRKLIGQGEIVYPHYFGKNLLTSLCDGMRPAWCLGMCRRFMNGKYPLMFHGSHIIIRADIEDKVQWDFGTASLTEDILFCHKAYKIFGAIFGWCNGILEEQSPFSIKDFFKQRRRWFVGICQCVKSPLLTIKSKIFLTYSLFTWTTGLLALIVVIIDIIFPTPIPMWIQIPALFDMFVLFSLYQIGLIRNIQPLNLTKNRKIKYHFLAFILTPLLGLLEILTAVYALIFMPKDYDIIKK